MTLSVDAVIVTKRVDDVLPETIRGLKTYPFKAIIVVAAIEAAKPSWCDSLAIDKGKLGKARNIGADIADSDFLCMIDEDIVLIPSYISNLLKHFQDPRTVAVGGQLRSTTVSVYALTKAQAFRGYCKTHSDVPCGGTIYRTNVLKRERFDDSLAGGEDHELHVRLKRKKYRVIFDDKISCFHYFKGTMKKEVFLCMLSGARTGWIPCIVRAVISPLRSLLLAIACRDNIYSLLISPFYITQWIAHVFGNLFTEDEIRVKMKALN
jgi:glycosyltransferase involved in cell wall biosynthesis